MKIYFFCAQRRRDAKGYRKQSFAAFLLCEIIFFSSAVAEDLSFFARKDAKAQREREDGFLKT
jgi:hypothetical protein